MRDGADTRGLPLFEAVVLRGALGLGAVPTERGFLIFSPLLSLGWRVPANLVFLFSLKGFGFGVAKASRE